MSSSALAAGIRYLRCKLAAQQRCEDSDEQLLHAFMTRRDDSAFAVLVRRHGPMVLHVCRRVLGHEQDAEDAFQATFLVLAQSGASLRNKIALASFLHGTAYRTALKAKQSAVRRRKHEGSLGALTQPRSPADPSEELLWREVRTLLDEEIARLPEIYRSVFVLCCLEELSQTEAARRLGVKVRTVSNRLAEARKRLASRLTRRGVELTAVLAATALAAPQASALSPLLVSTTIKAALATAAGEGLASVVSASVIDLVQGMTTAMMVSKAKIATVVLLAVSLLGGAGLVWSGGVKILSGGHQPPEAGAARGADAPRSAKHETTKTVEIQGRVVDPDGKPVRGAKLLLLAYSDPERLRKVWATSHHDGRFQFTVPPEIATASRPETWWENVHVMAAAEGHGFAVAKLGKDRAADLTLRLVKDDAPIRGRILDLQGKPVAGARVWIKGSLFVPEKGDLTAWLAGFKDPNRDPNYLYTHLMYLYSPAFDLLFPPVTTGADGRFCLPGIGRERVAELRIEGPAIATQAIHAMTRPHEAIHLPFHRDRPKRRTIHYYGADFDLVAAPTRPVVGVVRDRDSGKPLAGVKIQSELPVTESKIDYLRTVTDSEGRYRLAGLPKGEDIKIVATTNDFPRPPQSDMTKQPAYLSAIKKAENPLGLGPVTVDFALKRGAWIKGRITDKSTGKPLTAHVEYFCFTDNPNVKDVPFDLHFFVMRWTGEDGSFLIPALPGRGLIAVRADQDHYIMGAGAESIKERNPESQGGVFSTVPYFCYAGNFHALVEINPKPGAEAITCNFALDPGRSLKGTVLGPDGRPLAGAQISGLKHMGYWLNAGAEFTVESLQPNKSRVLQFMHESKKLAGVLVLRGDEKGPISVRLEPWGALTGRLVSPRGEPLAGLRVDCRLEVIRKGETLDTAAHDVQSDKDGRFRIKGLAPGQNYHDFAVLKGVYLLELASGVPKKFTLKPGETKDLGDLTVKPME